MNRRPLCGASQRARESARTVECKGARGLARERARVKQDDGMGNVTMPNPQRRITCVSSRPPSARARACNLVGALAVVGCGTLPGTAAAYPRAVMRHAEHRFKLRQAETHICEL